MREPAAVERIREPRGRRVRRGSERVSASDVPVDVITPSR
jgi:hypothetical protein